jgi:diguanylate cyclase (GGDEF)-like protein
MLGGLVFFASTFLFFTCNMGSFSPICFLLFPHVGSVVKHPKYTITICLSLFLTAAIILLTPMHEMLGATYSQQYRMRYPLLLFCALSIVCYLEVLRQGMNKKLTKMEKRLQTMAYRDQLTKLYNRHALLSHFDNLFKAADGHSFALVDLDDFKRVNDLYGHFVGDDVLRHIADVISHQIPAEGCLYRWGGEEFLIVVREIPKAAFIELLERIRIAIQRTPLCQNGKAITVTASFGAICGVRGQSVQSCLLQADKQLYYAKKNGKNQVIYQNAS